jgi:hypothetical protein
VCCELLVLVPLDDGDQRGIDDGGIEAGKPGY